MQPPFWRGRVGLQCGWQSFPPSIPYLGVERADWEMPFEDAIVTTKPLADEGTGKVREEAADALGKE